LLEDLKLLESRGTEGVVLLLVELLAEGVELLELAQETFSLLLDVLAEFLLGGAHFGLDVEFRFL
jgi:hypothetical protein